MAIKLKCPNSDCAKVLTVGDELAGQKGKCPACGTAFKIPGGGGSSGSSQQKQRPRPSSGSGGQRSGGQKSGGQRSGSQKSSGGQSAFSQARNRPSSGQQKRRPAPPPADDFSIDEEEEFYDDYGGGGDDYYEEDYGGGGYDDGGYGGGGYDDGGYDDYDDGGYSAPRPRKKGGGGGNLRKKWGQVRIGLTICAIAMCVFAGAWAMFMIGEVFGQVGGMIARSAIKARTEAFSAASPSATTSPFGTPRSRPSFDFSAYEAASKKSAKKMKTASKLAKAAEVFMKIGHVTMFIACIGLVVGYVFCVFAPSTKGAMGMAIATLALAAVNLILRLIFKLIAVFGNDFIFDRITFTTGFGLRGTTSDGLTGRTITTMFFDIGMVGEFILLALFMATVAGLMKDRRQKGDSMKVMYLLIAYASVMLMLYIFAIVGFNAEGDTRWVGYVIKTLGWAGNVLMTLVLIFFINNLFYARKATR